MSNDLKAPFVFFGGKAAVASIVWDALGQPKHYLEPCFGSGAVLLARPDYQPGVHIESVNDADGHLCNVWRSLQFSPDETARWCDRPVNHADLMARKVSIIANEGRLLDGLSKDPEFHDPKQAGYWLYSASCWIGSGLTCPGQRPHLSDGGKGVHKLGKRPHLSDGGMGVHKPGKHCQPDIDKHVTEPYNVNLWKWFRELSERLRYVRVVCGDWTRVCGGDWQDNMGTVGIFFDPPYSTEAGRDNNIYHKEDLSVAHAVREWALERGDRDSYRIVLAGYFDEHKSLLDNGWTVHQWKTSGGYGKLGKGKTQGKENRFKEALFFSPHCLSQRQGRLL